MRPSTLFSLATLLPFLSSPVLAEQPSVSLVRWRNFEGHMADFYMGASTEHTDHLKFWYDANNPSQPFTLDDTTSPGQGEFRVGLGGGKWANCHLKASSGVAATSKKFQFAPSDRDNYLYPCHLQEWVEVICTGTEPLCKEEGWEAPAQQVRPPM